MRHFRALSRRLAVADRRLGHSEPRHGAFAIATADFASHLSITIPSAETLFKLGFRTLGWRHNHKVVGTPYAFLSPHPAADACLAAAEHTCHGRWFEG